MRLYEITRDNELLVILYQLNSEYHPLWLELNSLLHFFMMSGDPIPQEFENKVNNFKQNLLDLKKILFDDSDPDSSLFFEEIDTIVSELDRYKSILGI
jgi:hypothetical protein